MIELDAVERPTDVAELMEIFVTAVDPAGEFDTELERRVGLAQELVLVDPQLVVEFEDWRNGRFADADCPDRFGFD